MRILLLLLSAAWLGCAHSEPRVAAPAHPHGNAAQPTAVRLPVCPMTVAAPLVQLQELPDGAALLFIAKDDSAVAELRRQLSLLARLHNQAVDRPLALPPMPPVNPEDPVAFEWLSGVNQDPSGFGYGGSGTILPAPLPSSPSIPTPEPIAPSTLTPLPPSYASIEAVEAGAGTPAGARLKLETREPADLERLTNALDERAMALGSGYCLLVPLPLRGAP